MKIEPAQLEKLKSLEIRTATLRELQPQHDLLVARIPEIWSRQSELRKQIAGFSANELLKISPAVQAAWDELARVEFLYSHSGNCKARISSEIAKIEAEAKRGIQEFLITFRQTISDQLTGPDKTWAFSLTSSTGVRGATIADQIDSVVLNVHQIQAKFPTQGVAS